VEKGDLVLIIAPPSICWDLAGKIGVVLEYIGLDGFEEKSWFPSEPIVVVLVDSYTTFFYEHEIKLITDKE